jgi:alanyl-tRNA synthetase
MRSADEIRQQFIDFFVKKHGHTAVASSSVVPHDDPTLLFTNAGMNQFKDVFLGTGSRAYKRAVDTQKCIRAGGKHNDLDDVGKDTYHHTFFEMLGNWSFGDYFKKEAIRWAWELLTEVWGMDKSRLHATVFEGDVKEKLAPDDEAAALWRSETDIDPSHIHMGNKKDNFWEMGETGPCGPCTEIHYDRTPDKSGGRLVNKGTPDVIEIWNLVFIQFNRGADRALTPLPAKHVDTGMGFERVTAVLQGKASNYDTDVFTPIFAAIQKVTGAPAYTGILDDLKDTAYRVIADHIRALTFSLTDGAVPSNEKRGYVVRSILRRAERYGWQQLATTKPFLHELVPVVVGVMGEAFPELKRQPQQVAHIIHEEEKNFLRTLERGLGLFERAAAAAIGEAVEKKRGLKHVGFGTSTARKAEAVGKSVLAFSWLTFMDDGGHIVQLPFPSDPEEQRKFMEQQCNSTPVILGKAAFDLHTEQGVFIDIIEQMAAEAGLRVDRQGYEWLYLAFREASGKDRKKHVVAAVSGELPKTDDAPKYDGLSAKGKVIGWVKNNAVVKSGRLAEGDEAALLLDRTNFYAEQGGQVGDQGFITTQTGRFEVEDTKKLGEAVLHLGRIMEGYIEPGQSANLEVGGARPHTMRNHTATHLMNWALRKVLGGEINQKGSLVDAEKTRFDFTHDKPLSAEEIVEVEQLVNEKVYADLPVTPVTTPLAEAKKIIGVRAVFGEKYPDPVRVLLIGAETPKDATLETSVEFCGGTHLAHTGQAGFFKIVSQEGVGKGVRRVTAVTGREAVAVVQHQAALLDDLGGRLNCKPDEIAGRVAALQEEVKKLQTQLKKGAASDLAGAGDKLLAAAVEVNGAKIIVGEMPSAPTEQMRQQVDRLRQKAGSGVVVVGWAEDGKVGLLAAVTEELTKKGVDAGKLVGAAAQVVGGKGGGRKDMAQAGGKDPSKLTEALQVARKLAEEQLNSFGK